MIDIDHFKAVNDNYGHLMGDEIIIGMSKLIAAAFVRSDDLVARYSGEWIVAVLTHTSLNEANGSGGAYAPGCC